MATITKRDIVLRIANRTGLPQNDVKQMVQTFLDEIIEVLSEGHKVEFRDFGVFHVIKRRARMGRNPRNGEKVFVPAKRSVNFRMGRRMRNRLMEEDGIESSEAGEAKADAAAPAASEPQLPVEPRPAPLAPSAENAAATASPSANADESQETPSAGEGRQE